MPRLVGPERLTIRPLDRASLDTSEASGEPSTHVPRSTSVVILAQVAERSENARQAGQGGARIPASVQITFDQADLDRLGYAPADGDLVVEVADRRGLHARTVRWYLSGVREEGKDSTGRRLTVADAASRLPSRVQNEGT